MCEGKFVKRMTVHTPAGDVHQHIDAAVVGFDLNESRVHGSFLSDINAQK